MAPSDPTVGWVPDYPTASGAGTGYPMMYPSHPPVVGPNYPASGAGTGYPMMYPSHPPVVGPYPTPYPTTVPNPETPPQPAEPRGELLVPNQPLKYSAGKHATVLDVQVATCEEEEHEMKVHPTPVLAPPVVASPLPSGPDDVSEKSERSKAATRVLPRTESAVAQHPEYSGKTGVPYGVLQRLPVGYAPAPPGFGNENYKPGPIPLPIPPLIETSLLPRSESAMAAPQPQTRQSLQRLGEHATREEREANARLAFREFDSDGNGFLDIYEFCEVRFAHGLLNFFFVAWLVY